MMIISCGKDEIEETDNNEVKLFVHDSISYDNGFVELELYVNASGGIEPYQYNWQNTNLTNRGSHIMSFNRDTVINVVVYDNSNSILGRDSIFLNYDSILYNSNYYIDIINEMCKIRFYDDLNNIHSNLVYRRNEIHSFSVELLDTNDILIETYYGTIDRQSYINFEAIGVPDRTIDELCSEYYSFSNEILNNGYLYNYNGQCNYTLLDCDNCSLFGISSIEFLIFQWIYYG